MLSTMVFTFLVSYLTHSDGNTASHLAADSNFKVLGALLPYRPNVMLKNKCKRLDFGHKVTFDVDGKTVLDLVPKVYVALRRKVEGLLFS